MKQRFWLLLFLFLAACQPSTSLSEPEIVSTPILPAATSTLRPAPAFTFTPSLTPTVEKLIFPYTIEGLRQHEYQGGKLHIRSKLDENEVFTTYLIDYPSDGLTVTGIMQIPVGDGPFPVIVLNHGFFSRSQFKSGDGTDRAAAFLAKHGYITLAPDYRSWGESDTGTSFFYSGLAIDVINC